MDNWVGFVLNYWKNKLFDTQGIRTSDETLFSVLSLQSHGCEHKL